ncbi:MAG TPA: RteC domain-containing protein [Flavihumibacter sp.]|nr:RteC domain-containing protein [Flavihumibacter sp.]
MRGKHDIKLGLDTFYFETDHRFCTSHDYKVAKIIANDLIQVYIEDLLASLDTKEASITSVTPSLKLHWSENKTSLIELIYALYSQNVFDNGKADIKTIAAYFENVFNIELGDYYRTYLELRTRKTSRTKFIDILKVSLEKRMDEVEDK